MVEPPGPGRRHGAALATLVVLVGTPACSDHPVSPLPVRPPLAATSAAAPPSSATTPAADPSRTVPPRPGTGSRAPTRTRAARPTPSARSTAPAACLGAVRHDLNLAETELALVRSLCFAAGGVLRIQGVGPGEVTVDREELVSRSYEAGVLDVRFVRVGTVVVTVPQNGRTYPITVVVV